MTFMIERLVDAYSTALGEHKTWRKVRTLVQGGRPLEWPTRREAERFADLFVANGTDRDITQIVEVEDAT